jgi:hypothetical protein
MKFTPFILVSSTLLNVAVIAVVIARPTLAPAAWREAFHWGGRATETAPAARAQPRPEARRALWSLLGTPDLPTLVARLKAAGFPAAVIREIVRAEVEARFGAKMRAFFEPDPNTPFWRRPSNTFSAAPGKYEEYQTLLRERARLLRAVLGDPFFAETGGEAAQRRKFGDLPQQKIDLLQRIEDDYAEMNSAVRGGTNGVVFPEDKAKLALLAKEKRADLEQILTPAEMADYEMRSSPITRVLSRELGEFHANEAEYRAIFAMHQAMNDKYPYVQGSSPGMGSSYQERRDTQKQLETQLRTALGDARFNDYLRETTSEYQQVRSLALRENLPVSVATQAFDLRNTVAAESQRIAANPALDADQKRAALATLAQTTRTQTLALLGPNAGPAYVKTIDSAWLNIVAGGAAVTFDGGPNRSLGSENVLLSFGRGPSFQNIRRATPPQPK